MSISVIVIAVRARSAAYRRGLIHTAGPESLP
jgi:hypothetical protein